MKKETKKKAATIKMRADCVTSIALDEILTMDMAPYRKLFKEWKDRGINDHYPKDIIKKDASK